MKRILLLVLAIGLIVVGLFLLLHVSKNLQTFGQGALQVTTNIKSTVYLNDKQIGSTPLCKCNQKDTLREGDYTIRIEPEDKTTQSFSAKIKIHKGVLTAVERTFLPGSLASSYVLTLEKINSSEAQLLIASIPDNAIISLDGQPLGVSPRLEKKVTPSEHEIEVQKAGFAKKTIRVRTVTGYKLLVDVMLGTEGKDIVLSPTPSPSTGSPTPSGGTQKPSLTVLDTPTGFLRVRSLPSTNGQEVGQVDPGETYEILEEQNGWYKIQLKSSTTTGWISGQYARKETP